MRSLIREHKILLALNIIRPTRAKELLLTVMMALFQSKQEINNKALKILVPSTDCCCMTNAVFMIVSSHVVHVFIAYRNSADYSDEMLVEQSANWLISPL